MKSAKAQKLTDKLQDAEFAYNKTKSDWDDYDPGVYSAKAQKLDDKLIDAQIAYNKTKTQLDDATNRLV